MAAAGCGQQSRRRIAVCILAWIAGAVMISCSQETRTEEPPVGTARSETSSRLSVQAVNYPLQYFARRIGGDRVVVAFPAPTGVDPAIWSPAPETVAAYQGADLLLLNGAGYAQWVQRASLAPSRLVDTSAAFRSRYIPLEDTVTHGHGPSGEHSHEGFAFTTWLDPTLAVEQAGAILQAFTEKRPAHEVRFQEGFASLEADLLALDRSWADWAELVGDAPLFFSHPVYQYFTRRYGLNAISLHWEPNALPDESQWQQLEELRRDHEARWMIWENEPIPATVERLRSLGIESVVLPPCANTPGEGDYLTVMRRAAETLRAHAVSEREGRPASSLPGAATGN